MTCGVAEVESLADAMLVRVFLHYTVAVAVGENEATEVTTALEEALGAETKDASKIEATLTKVKEEYAKLVEEGKVEEAKKYALKIQEFISNNSESLKSAASSATVVSLIDGIKNLPTSAEATLNLVE